MQPDVISVNDSVTTTQETGSSCSFINQGKKLALIISVLIASCACDIEVEQTIRGTLTCSHPFHYRLTLWEQDIIKDSVMSKPETLPSINNKAKYEIKGMGTEWTIVGPSLLVPFIPQHMETEIEPLLTIEHSCGSVYACTCRDLGGKAADSIEIVDILLDTDENYCSACEKARALIRLKEGLND